MRRALTAILLIASAVLACLLWKSQQSADQPVQVSSPAAAGWQQAGASNPFGQGAASAERTTLVSAASREQAPDLASTSLAGTQADGDWGVDAQGRFLASRALRQRFDYYLSLIGEMPLARIEAAFRAAAEKDLKHPALGQVLALWSSYVQLQQHNWRHAVNLQKPESWSAALSERQIVRRQMLGADVAYAFYAQEDAQLQQMITQVLTGQGAQAEQIPAQALHHQAVEREAAVQAQWQQWELRLQAARSQIQAYSRAPELSALQRQQAIEQYLTSQFQGTELVRARSLLGV